MQTFLLVDDTDSSILYAGMEAGPLNVLPTRSFFNDTFHHLSNSGQETGASISFSFSGTEVLVGGLTFQKDDQLFSPRCTIDGQFSPVAPPSDHVGTICVGQNLSNGQHTIAVSIPATNSSSQLWIDFIQYLPSSPTSQGTMFTAGTNLAALGPEWGSNQGDATSFAGVQTNVNGANIDVNFTGSSFSWFGCPSDKLPRLPPANVAYTIDGKSKETVANNTLILFDADLENGNHHINVKYSGSSNEMPLTFCGYTFDSGMSTQLSGGSASSNSNTGSTMSSPNKMTSSPAAASTSGAPQSHVDAGPILGAVIGGLVLGVFVVLGILLLRRYRRRQQAPPDYSDFEQAMYVRPPSALPQMPAPARILSTWRQNLPFSDKERPPMPPRRSSISKSIYSIQSFTSYHPSPQTAQVGSEYGGSLPSSPRLRSSGWLGPRNYQKFSSMEPILL